MVNLNMNTTSGNSINLNKSIVQNANIQERNNFYSFPNHMHQNIEIYYFLEGSCNMDIGKKTITTEEGDLVMILPNIVHSFYLSSNDNCKFIHIHFEPSDLTYFFIEENNVKIDLFSLISSIKQYCKLTADNDMVSLLYSIINKKNNPNMFSETLCNLHIIELLIHIIKREEITLFFQTQTSKIMPRYVLFALDYIRMHYSEKILISDISNHLNISSRYLSKLFHDATSLTVLQYINIYRINQSINLMMTTDDSLTEISFNVGFSDIQHFSKLFSSIIGISPRKYKKLLLN